jgi:hypothetical protein
MTPPRAHGPAEPARRTRAARVGLVAIAALVVLHGGTLAVLSRSSVEARLRARLEAALGARLGNVAVDPGVHVDPLFRVSFGPVTVAGLDPRDPPTLRIERVRVRVRLLALLAGRVEPASVHFFGVRVVAGSGGEGLRALANRLRLTSPRPSVALARPAFAPEPESESALPA